jgi:hypothetical protein
MVTLKNSYLRLYNAFCGCVFTETINLYPIFDDYNFQMDDVNGTNVMVITADVISGGNRAFAITDRKGYYLPAKAVKIIERAKNQYKKYKFTDFDKAERIRRNARIRFIKAVSDAINDRYIQKESSNIQKYK